MTITGEIADALVAALESPPAQSALITSIAAGEVPLEGFLDSTIANLKVGGILGVVITAAKGTVEAELNAQFKQYPPAAIAAYLTKLAQEEAKSLGG